jgi:hypothetical protein
MTPESLYSRYRSYWFMGITENSSLKFSRYIGGSGHYYIMNIDRSYVYRDDRSRIIGTGFWHPLQLMPENKTAANVIKTVYLTHGTLALISNNYDMFAVGEDLITPVRVRFNNRKEVIDHIRSYV